MLYVELEVGDNKFVLVGFVLFTKVTLCLFCGLTLTITIKTYEYIVRGELHKKSFIRKE